MSERAAQLFQTADAQISGLITLLGAADDAALRAPCPGREKLGDGTVAAVAMHTADNYHQIAEYLAADTRPVDHGPQRRHRIPRVLGAHGARPGHGHDDGDGPYAARNVDRQGLLERLTTARTRLSALGELSDERLSAVPPVSEMRFADGQRTLEEILASVLKHQDHQRDALAAALSGSRRVA